MTLNAIAELAIKKANKVLQDLETRAEASRREYMASAPAGTTIPKTAKFYDDRSRNDAQEMINKEFAEIQLALDDFVANAQDHRGDAPSEEALRLVMLLRDRKTLSAEELIAADARFGANYSTHKALEEIASAHQIHSILPSHEMDVMGEKIRRIKVLMDLITIRNFESGKLTPGAIAFQAMFIK